MANEVEICSLALSRIGANTISSLSDTTREAIACSNVYAASRDSVLRDHDWSFARGYLALALLSETHPEWDFVYAYPADCLAARRIYNAFSDEERYEIPYDMGISVNRTSQVVLTDQEEAILIYTVATANTAVYDKIFVDALAWRIGAELVTPLRANSALSQALGNRYVQVLNDAKSKTSNEPRQPPSTGSSITDARGYNFPRQPFPFSSCP